MHSIWGRNVQSYLLKRAANGPGNQSKLAPLKRLNVDQEESGAVTNAAQLMLPRDYHSN